MDHSSMKTHNYWCSLLVAQRAGKPARECDCPAGQPDTQTEVTTSDDIAKEED